MVSRKVTPWLVGAVLILVAGLASAPPAEAVASITFDQVIQGGTLSYDVGGPLVGTDILFDFLVVAGTPAADGVYDCVGCELNFTTGNSVGDDDGPVYTFGTGGSFVLTGTIPDLGILANVVLLSGTWNANPANPIAVAAGSNISFIGNGIDTKNADLAAALGIDPELWRYANSEFSLGAATVNPDGSFTGAITQADLQNIKAPEPGSAFLLLLGLGSLAAYRRRRN